MRVLDPSDDSETEAVSLGTALTVLRRGLAATPVLRSGLWFSAGMAVATALGRLVIPVLLQQVIDRGVIGGYRPGFIAMASAIALALSIVVFFLSRATYLRLMLAAERALFELRLQAFRHIHRLSLADHTESKRGLLVARVTSDIETIARFVEWGAVAWIVNGALIVGIALLLLVFSWQLAVVAIASFSLMIPVLRGLQRRQLQAYDQLRFAVGETMGETAEAVMGAEVIRAYGIGERARRRLRDVIDAQYRAQMRAARYFSVLFTLGDLFGAVTLALVVGIGVWFGPDWGVGVGELIAILFLVNLAHGPVAEIGEVLDQTQIAIAGWRKVLGVLDREIELVEPAPGLPLPDGALEVRTESLGFAYRDDVPVLRDVSVTISAGSNVAIVGETGSGKTTFAKLLCRLSDPTSGTVLVGGVPLPEVAPESRRAGVRMVPQDGFLFDTSIEENVRYGWPGATRVDVAESFARLGLDWWVLRLPDGLDTRVGERGENLSVGERQLVALARAQLADPGLLVLDEATSAVDPETDRALTVALARLMEGRTTISIAHRLSTAEGADLVLVFDAGEIVESGSHDSLVARGGRYGELYEGWLGNTRSTV